MTVEQVHRGKPEQVFHRMDHAYGSVETMVNERRFRTWRILADDQRSRAMRIHMIGSVLRIILNYENGSVVPVRAMRHRINHAANREIVIGDRGSRRRLAHACST